MATVAKTRRQRKPKTSEHYMEALARARAGCSPTNTMIVLTEMQTRGFTDVRPYENVLTFDAWRGAGRTVKRGEHGTKITVFVPMEVAETDERTGETKTKTITRPRTSVVFHVSQTDPWNGNGNGKAVA